MVLVDRVGGVEGSGGEMEMEKGGEEYLYIWTAMNHQSANNIDSITKGNVIFSPHL
jgi:hypothetical protein